MMLRTRTLFALAAVVSLVGMTTTDLLAGGRGKIRQVLVGGDASNVANAFIQPQDPALSGGGRDQTQKFGDALSGSRRDDLLIGQLGVDVLIGDRGHDVLVGGPEHFNPENRDRAFGGPGNDIFIWAPGDGSDFFDGGKGKDIVIFGLLGEDNGDGGVRFGVSTDQQTADLVLDPDTRLPIVDVAGSPGTCDVLFRGQTPESTAALDELGVDHLVQFTIRGIRAAFEAGDQTTDNGLRVTLSLKSVETLVCTSPEGGGIEAFDLRQDPPVAIPLDRLPRRVRSMLRQEP